MWIRMRKQWFFTEFLIWAKMEKIMQWFQKSQFTKKLYSICSNFESLLEPHIPYIIIFLVYYPQDHHMTSPMGCHRNREYHNIHFCNYFRVLNIGIIFYLETKKVHIITNYFHVLWNKNYDSLIGIVYKCLVVYSCNYMHKLPTFGPLLTIKAN